MTPQEELELLNELFVYDKPILTHANIAHRIGELLNIVKPLSNTIETEIPGLFYEHD